MAVPPTLCDRIVVAQLTSPNRGAIASVGILGLGAERLITRLLRSISGRPLRPFTLGTVRLCEFQFAQYPPEKVIAAQIGPHQFEIYCHGGPVAVSRILTAAQQHGASVISWEDWLSLTHPSLITAEALVALTQAKTRRVASILSAQTAENWDREIRTIREHILSQAWDTALERVDRLVARWAIGGRMVDGWVVALVGPPNAGKSSLFNRLLAEDRAIVHPTAGTTRDLLRATISLDGWPVTLIDTPGYGPTDDPLEKAAMARARNTFTELDLGLFVLDVTQNRAALLEETILPPDRILTVFNKIDLLSTHSAGQPSGSESCQTGFYLVSAKTGEGIAELVAAIVRRLVPGELASDEPVPFTSRQHGWLESLRQAVQGRDPAASCNALKRLGCENTIPE